MFTIASSLYLVFVSPPTQGNKSLILLLPLFLCYLLGCNDYYYCYCYYLFMTFCFNFNYLNRHSYCVMFFSCYCKHLFFFFFFIYTYFNNIYGIFYKKKNYQILQLLMLNHHKQMAEYHVCLNFVSFLLLFNNYFNTRYQYVLIFCTLFLNFLL